MIGVQLLQLLEQAGRVTPADLEQIDRQIEVLRAFRDFAAAKLAPPAPASPSSALAPAGEAPRGKARPPLPDAGAATPPRKPRPNPRPDGGKRLAIARLIGREGPLPSAAIVARLDIPPTSMISYIRHPWFGRNGNRKGPIVLTEAGRAALATEGGSKGA